YIQERNQAIKDAENALKEHGNTGELGNLTQQLQNLLNSLKNAASLVLTQDIIQLINQLNDAASQLSSEQNKNNSIVNGKQLSSENMEVDSITTNDDKNKLPQTDESGDSLQTLGLLSLLMMMFGIAGKKRKKEDSK
ncbi:MAG: LPXTG cell wall anchor domain-containing protein, partial [Paucilactobacillus nenjiangensis]